MKISNKIILVIGVGITSILASCIVSVSALLTLKPGYYVMDGASMEPNLENGTTFLTRDAGIQRGDIIVFETKSGPALVKRIIALPGELVKIEDGKIYIDGQIYSENYLEAGTVTNNGTNIAEGEEIKVPKDSYFVLGDNRSNSRDSRSADIGFVQEDDIKGVVWIKL